MHGIDISGVFYVCIKPCTLYVQVKFLYKKNHH